MLRVAVQKLHDARDPGHGAKPEGKAGFLSDRERKELITPARGLFFFFGLACSLLTYLCHLPAHML